MCVYGTLSPASSVVCLAPTLWAGEWCEMVGMRGMRWVVDVR